MQEANNEIYNKNRITPPKNERQTLMGVMTATDDEEQSVKFRGGIPKYLLPKNQRIADLKQAESDLQTPSKNDKSAPSTPKSKRKQKDVHTPKCVADIPVTPENKYGFLRSFDGKQTINNLSLVIYH